MNPRLERIAEARRRGEGVSRPPTAASTGHGAETDRPMGPLMARIAAREGLSTPPIAPPTDARPAQPPLTLLTGQAREAAQARVESLRAELALVTGRTLGDFIREDGEEVGRIREEIATVAASIGLSPEPRPSYLGPSQELDAGLQFPRGKVVYEASQDGKPS